MLCRIETAGCPVLLVADSEDTLKLISLDLSEREPIEGTMPEACLKDRCLFWGVDTSVGPMVAAMPAAPESDIAAGAHLGVVHDEALRFIDLWAGAGEPVHGDGTDLGPAFSLEPWVCDRKLGLFVAPRLPAAKNTDPPEELVAREGTYALSGDWERTDSASRDGCKKIEIELP